MKHYAKLNDNNIVVGIVNTSEILDELEFNIKDNVQIGMRWNGSTFEEVPTEESDNVSRETSMADLEDYCLTIIELLTDEKEGE